MKLSKLENMINGWFVGDFKPSLLQTQDVEVAVKNYQQGEFEVSHYHKIATEITVIVSGLVKMNGEEYKKGDIVIIDPHESTDFVALEDTITVVVKRPGAVNDKYIDGSNRK
jgi:hypothetical protein